jgi:predicted nuclease of restriction endonuclease-like (RecB) superfamily
MKKQTDLLAPTALAGRGKKKKQTIQADNAVAAGDYTAWIAELKTRYRALQLKAATAVNVVLLEFYWKLGRDISARYEGKKRNAHFFERLSADLRSALPDAEGFSPRNLKYMLDFYELYRYLPQAAADNGGKGVHLPQPVADCAALMPAIPWGHHRLIIDKCRDDLDEALFYVGKTAENGWSRSVLMNMMDAGLYRAQGRAVTNFAAKLPAPESDLAQQTLKDPYCFDFLALRERYTERELEEALVGNVTRFLLELGNGFSLVGRQFRLEVGGEEFFADLLFYHLKLRRYVVVELKTEAFRPEFTGQLGFYVQAVNEQLKHPSDNDAIGLLICKRRNRLVAEWALKSSAQLLGVSEYRLTKLLPEDFKSSLPSVRDIEEELEAREKKGAGK